MRTRDDQPLRAKIWGIACPGGTKLTDEVIASSGVTFHLWRLYQHPWLVGLFFPLASLVHGPLAASRLALGLSALLFFSIHYTWLKWPHPLSPRVRARAGSRLAYLLF